MLPSSQHKGSGWARASSAPRRASAADVRSSSRPRGGSQGRGGRDSSKVVTSAARPSSSAAANAKRSSSPPPPRAASVALAPPPSSTAWLHNPVAFSPELARWADTLITAYHANNSKLGRMAQSGLERLEAWRQGGSSGAHESTAVNAAAGDSHSLRELDDMRQKMMLKLAALKQQLAAVGAAEKAELQRGASVEAATINSATSTGVSTINTAAFTIAAATATATTITSVAAPVASAAPAATATTASNATASPPTSSVINSLFQKAASDASAAATAPQSPAVTTNTTGVQLIRWADKLITRHLGASRLLPHRKRQKTAADAAAAAAVETGVTEVALKSAPQQRLKPWEVAIHPNAQQQARIADMQLAIHGAATADAVAAAAAVPLSPEQVSLEQLQHRWEEELWMFRAESDALLRELAALQQQHLAHITAAAASSESQQDEWQQRWGKAHAEIRALAAAATAPERHPLLTAFASMAEVVGQPAASSSTSTMAAAASDIMPASQAADATAMPPATASAAMSVPAVTAHAEKQPAATPSPRKRTLAAPAGARQRSGLAQQSVAQAAHQPESVLVAEAPRSVQVQQAVAEVQVVVLDAAALSSAAPAIAEAQYAVQQGQTAPAELSAAVLEDTVIANLGEAVLGVPGAEASSASLAAVQLVASAPAADEVAASVPAPQPASPSVAAFAAAPVTPAPADTVVLADSHAEHGGSSELVSQAETPVVAAVVAAEQVSVAKKSRGQPAGWDVFGQLLYVALRASSSSTSSSHK